MKKLVPFRHQTRKKERLIDWHRHICHAKALQETQVYEQVDEGILVGDGATIAQMRSLDTQCDGL